MKSLTSSYRVDHFDVDAIGHLSVGVFGRRLLACAANHADACGFGQLQFGAQRGLWVLSRLTIAMERWPRLHDDYVITTWIQRVFHGFVERRYEIAAADGTFVGSAVSIWAVIGDQSRELITDESLSSAVAPYVDARSEEHFGIKPPVGGNAGEAVDAIANHRAVWSDLDENGHVNSVRYIQMALDALPANEMRTRNIATIHVAYPAEAAIGEELTFALCCPSETVRRVDISALSPDGGKPRKLCRCIVEWGN